MSTALVTVDPKWTALLSTIPETLIDPRDYPRLVLALEGVAECKSWAEIAPHGLSRPEYMMLKRRSKEFLALAKEAEAIANDIRHNIREQEAHDRAVNGEQTPTVDKNGNIVDWYPKRSDKLLELLLKASDPKYKDSKAGESGGARIVLSVNFGIPSRISQPATIDMEEVTHDDRSRALKSPDQVSGHHTGDATAETGALEHPHGALNSGGSLGEIGAEPAGNPRASPSPAPVDTGRVSPAPQGEADEEAVGAPAPAPGKA